MLKPKLSFSVAANPSAWKWWSRGELCLISEEALLMVISMNVFNNASLLNVVSDNLVLIA